MGGWLPHLRRLLLKRKEVSHKLPCQVEIHILVNLAGIDDILFCSSTISKHMLKFWAVYRRVVGVPCTTSAHRLSVAGKQPVLRVIPPPPSYLFRGPLTSKELFVWCAFIVKGTMNDGLGVSRGTAMMHRNTLLSRKGIWKSSTTFIVGIPPQTPAPSRGPPQTRCQTPMFVFVWQSSIASGIACVLVLR